MDQQVLMSRIPGEDEKECAVIRMVLLIISRVIKRRSVIFYIVKYDVRSPEMVKKVCCDLVCVILLSI